MGFGIICLVFVCFHTINYVSFKFMCMKQLFYFTILAASIFVSCKKQKPADPVLTETTFSNSVATTTTSSTCGTTQVQTLLAGQTINSGSVSVSNDQVNLYVTYTTTGGWKLNKTHLYVGDCALIPKTNSGNPQIGLFPMQQTYSPMATSATYTIPLSSLSSCYCIAAHAEVVLLNSLGTIIQTETGWAQGNPMGGNSWAMVFNYCTQACTQVPPPPPCTISVGDFRTQTQGGWGATPNGNNPGVYLQANFASVFPTGLTVGCSSGYTLKLTSANAVMNFLPQGGTASALSASSIDPTTVNNVFAGQVVALSISVSFDQNIANFGASNNSLSGLVITSGDFAGWTVMQLLNEANRKLGGCTSVYSFAQLNAAVTSVNENFDNGTVVGSFLTCH